MAKITKLGEQKNRQAVYVDDNFVCYLQSFTIFKHKLFVGKEISLSELSQIQFESENDYAFNLALKHISKYTKTEKGLKDFLLSKGFLPKLCDAVVEKVKSYNYLSDERFAENFLENNKHRFGKNRIKQTLLQKGVDKKIVDSLEFDVDKNALCEMAKKYMKNKENTFQNRQKCAKFLIARGFDWSDVSAVMQELKGDDDFEDWQ